MDTDHKMRPATPMPAPHRDNPHRPLTMIAPAEALAMVYAAAYAASSDKNESRHNETVTSQARKAARLAVRDFCHMCVEQYVALELGDDR